MHGPRLMLQMQHIRQLSGVCFHATLSADRAQGNPEDKNGQNAAIRERGTVEAGAHLSRGIFAA